MCYDFLPLPCSRGGYDLGPVAEYDHQNGCAVVGGVVYRGDQAILLLQGAFIYADFCRGRCLETWSVLPANDTGWVAEAEYC